MSERFRSITVVAKDDPGARAVAEELVEWLERRDHPVSLEVATREGEGNPGALESPAPVDGDLTIVLGGDGTLLSVARRSAGAAPILGVNLGHLGYLTELPREGLYPALIEVLAGQFTLEARTLLAARLMRNDGTESRYLALNDVVVAKTAPSRIIELDLAVDGRPVSRYRADGLVISTPTGSTAYNLSAGGPILHPQLPVIVLTPICAHTLTLRPLVLPDTSTIEVRLATQSEMVFLTVDGQEGGELESGDRVLVRRHDRAVQLVRTAEPRSIFEGLRSKLHWGE